jgi:hypothetical protein
MSLRPFSFDTAAARPAQDDVHPSNPQVNVMVSSATRVSNHEARNLIETARNF